MAAALTLAAALPVWAQGSEGFVTDFEDGATGWSFQFTNEQAKWTVDSSPTVFVSPIGTLNNADSVVTLQAEGIADAYSPSAFFGGPGNRIIKHWCRFQFVEVTFGTNRWMKVGPQLLTNDVIAVFNYDSPDHPNGTFGNCPTRVVPSIFTDAPAGINGANGDVPDVVAPPPTNPPSYLVPCVAADWHEHTYFVQQGSGEIIHNGQTIPQSLEPSQKLENAVVMQVGFFFEWTGSDCDLGLGPVPFYGTVFWALDDLFISSSAFDPFGPDPSNTGGGGGGGGGGFDCVSGVVPAGGDGPGGGGMLPALIGLIVLGAAGLQMKRRLAAVQL